MAGDLLLILDDNDLNLKLLRDVLRFEGYRTAEAVTAASALAQAAREPPDLVLMNLGLPDLSGVDALARLRAAPATRTTPVLAVTASAMTGDRERLMAAGFDDYLAKPIRVRELRDRVRALCEPGP
jgi:two-component system, cell cycle response regulator DivK